ncbi:hypothetical protein AMTRI_Chr10g8030 [Amborella trichopoda]
MADRKVQEMKNKTSGSSVLSSSMAALVIGGPLLGMSGFSFLASMTILIISSPLFLIFSPLLLPVAFVLGCSMVAFAAAGLMGMAGFCAITCVFRSVRGQQIGRIPAQVVDTAQKAKEHGKELGAHLQQRVQIPIENKTRG